MSALELPQPISAYFLADNSGDSAGVARCFGEHGVVKDEGHTHSGREAIRKWKIGASAKYSYTSKPFAVAEKDGRYTVRSMVAGSFPGSPVELSYAFRLSDGGIASLEITA